MKNRLIAATALLVALPLNGQAQSVPGTIPMAQLPTALLTSARGATPSPQDGTIYMWPLSVTSYLVKDFQVLTNAPDSVSYVRTPDQVIDATNCGATTTDSPTRVVTVTHVETATATVTQDSKSTETAGISAGFSGAKVELAKAVTQATSSSTATSTGLTTTLSTSVGGGPMPPRTGLRFVPLQSREHYVNKPFLVQAIPSLGVIRGYQRGKPYYDKDWGVWDLSKPYTDGTFSWTGGFDKAPDPVYASGAFTGSLAGDNIVAVLTMSEDMINAACGPAPTAPAAAGAAKAMFRAAAPSPDLAPGQTFNLPPGTQVISVKR